jgi:hypothetical protein
MLNNCSFHFLFVRLFSLLCFIYVHTTNAEVSTQCQDATEAIDVNVTIIDPDLSCAENMEQTQCTFDYGPVNTNFTNECTSIFNGKAIYDDTEVKCVEIGSTIVRTFYLNNYPKCYATVCSDTDIE